MGAQNDVRQFDRAVAELAHRQYGVVARRQLLALGSAKTVATRLRAGWLVPIHRGVYAVGHKRLHRDGHWMAAVLAVGPGAVLSHRDAAALHGLRRPHNGTADVTTTARIRSTRAIRVHQTTALTSLDATTRHGIPVTTIARTLVDLASVVPKHQLAAALSEAERANVLDVDAIERTLERTRGRRGPAHARMRAVLREHRDHGAQLTRSELEGRFLALLDAHDLPRPRTNAILDGDEVDAYWPKHRLVVELDGWEFHKTRAAFERDRAKRTELEAAGWRVAAFTHRQVADEPATVAAQLRRLLARRPRRDAAARR
jgi:very-short-patch-repair endonuclease